LKSRGFESIIKCLLNEGGFTELIGVQFKINNIQSPFYIITDNSDNKRVLDQISVLRFNC